MASTTQGVGFLSESENGAFFKYNAQGKITGK